MFFCNGCRTQINWNRFGIIDDNSNQSAPAFPTNTDSHKWIADVNNKNSKELEFYAIDNCIRFYKSDEPKNLESTCDCALIDANTVVFIELKERTSKGWLAKASSQLINTIALYKQNDSSANAKEIIGHICNSLRPQANRSNMGEMAKFYKNSGGHKLFIQKRIDI
ncbi:hypothetical protein [Shewanella cyperi]|uniref:hypothetical protein n=1 Tax=Shewanella cyperi TaxID=2814292 RepID=UPI001A951B29|nr:hypothetical protein [Shewanella cyperi]QSX41827.1 hypothetical protein JYB84_05255 [Shewanella cyperi]